MTEPILRCGRSSKPVATAVLIAIALAFQLAAQVTAQVSSFGRYSGYSDRTYNGWTRRAEYLPMADGVELAVNYFLPTRGDEPARDPLPVILIYTRYLRVWEEEDGNIHSPIEDERLLRDLLLHGYALAIVNARGSGASFGTRAGAHSAEETADSYEVIEWIAAQTWCNGHVGMFGRSYAATNAYLAASLAPPHLDAVFADMAAPILYDLIYRGGTYKDDFVEYWSNLTRWMDLGRLAPPAPMDSDPDGSLRDAAVAEHAGNAWARTFGKKAKYRNSRIRHRASTWSWDAASAINRVAQIQDAGIPIYHLLGWYDIYTTQQAKLYVNLEPLPQKMAIGPWLHEAGFGGEIHTAEVFRWFDYWLKGVDNGVINGPPIHYFAMRGNNTVPRAPGLYRSQDEVDASEPSRWTATHSWPPANTRLKKYFLKEGPSRTVSSINDGKLSSKKPKVDMAKDDYRVDPTSKMGSFSRWMNGYGLERDDPPDTRFFDERTAEDEKALTFTSAKMKKDTLIAGYPVVHLWVTSTAKDGDFFAYLEEVDSEGRSHYVTEGMLRASMRALAEPEWDNLGLPFHRCYKKDRLKKLPPEPVELVFDLLGTAVVIDKGHRIRLTVAGADARNHALYPKKLRKPPTVNIYRDKRHRSHIELPISN